MRTVRRGGGATYDMTKMKISAIIILSSSTEIFVNDSGFISVVYARTVYENFSSFFSG